MATSPKDTILKKELLGDFSGCARVRFALCDLRRFKFEPPNFLISSLNISSLNYFKDEIVRLHCLLAMTGAVSNLKVARDEVV